MYYVLKKNLLCAITNKTDKILILYNQNLPKSDTLNFIHF